MKKSLKLVAVTLTFLITVAVAGPALWGEEANLDSTYQQLALRVQKKVELTASQTRELSRLIHERKESERHLRRQMLTTYTPEQRGRARQLWEQRDRAQAMTVSEARKLRKQVGITSAQEAQFRLYEEKLQAHRQQTAYLVQQMLDPRQRQLAKELEFVL